MGSPNELRQIRIVDEGIPVALHRIDCLVTVDLFLRDRVLAVPFHEQVLRIGREIGRCSGVHCRAVGRIERTTPIASRHIHERACEITFVVIVRLKDRS